MPIIGKTKKRGNTMKTKKVYIQRKDNNYLETVDQFETYKEARKMLKEYRMSDIYAKYYISQRCCANWK